MAGNGNDHPKDGNAGVPKTAPFSDSLKIVVEKIKNEPFLFVIGLAIILVGLAVLATGLGESNFRLIVIVIALLAFGVILGFYVQEGLKIRAEIQQEPKINHGRAEEDDQTQTPGLGSDESNTTEDTSTGTSKYNIDASQATGVAIGDNATIVQHIGGSEASTSSDPSTNNTVTTEEHRAALESQLAQHQRNLNRLCAKKGLYAADKEPLNLLNQIEAEERGIERIQAELAKIK